MKEVRLRWFKGVGRWCKKAPIKRYESLGMTSFKRGKGRHTYSLTYNLHRIFSFNLLLPVTLIVLFI